MVQSGMKKYPFFGKTTHVSCSELEFILKLILVNPITVAFGLPVKCVSLNLIYSMFF